MLARPGHTEAAVDLAKLAGVTPVAYIIEILADVASFATTQSVNDALRIGRGVLCAPMATERAEALALSQMVAHNTEKFGTKFTVSVDHRENTTGVSAVDCRMCKLGMTLI
ncbi:3,4-dihydroxy-2-butanone-4-phosphate synthase [Weissella confusa]|uniref:3,4-dihydroxy-2-butanone-4-phosphate synthase n=1 Tax=Weissella confusa TaxID=1583 RepID=A0A923NDB7_WEICO|nr:3,4-dihydroxy-2-butanone-4-phosphate synthase [Weissella confusa]